MTERYYPFDSGAGKGINEDDWRLLGKAMAMYHPGVMPDEGSQLAVFADSTGMHVKVPDGAAGAFGHTYLNDGPVVVDVDAADGTTRWDRIVLNFNFTANTILLGYVKGDTNPDGPALTQNRVTLWQHHLAFVRVGPAASTIAAGDVFLDAGRWGDGLGTLPCGSVVDFMGEAADVPIGWMLADGTALDWHRVPRLRDNSPTYTGPSGTSYGYEPGTGLVHLLDSRGRVIAAPDAMGQGAAGVLTDAAFGQTTSRGHVGGASEQPVELLQHAHDLGGSPNGNIDGNWDANGKAEINRSQQVAFVSSGVVDATDFFVMRYLTAAACAAHAGVALNGAYADVYRLELDQADATRDAGQASPTSSVVQPTITANKIVKVF